MLDFRDSIKEEVKTRRLLCNWDCFGGLKCLNLKGTAVDIGSLLSLNLGLYDRSF
jgi:hypothetical protein